MNTAERIAAAVDRHLADKTEIVVFGSAALLLDPHFAEHLRARMTNDVDIIIPDQDEVKVDADRGFWQAIEKANRELEPEGLYITHLFPEREVTLTPEWQQHLVHLDTAYLEKLQIARPRTLDLIISKMGRGDLQDVEDVRTLLHLEQKVSGQTITAAEVQAAAARARVPEVYREIFPGACHRIVAEIEEIGRALRIRAAQSMASPSPEEKMRQSRGLRP